MTPPRIQRTDAAWAGTKLWIEKLIADHMKVLEARTTNHDDTMFTRGAITQLRAMLHEIDPPAKA